MKFWDSSAVVPILVNEPALRSLNRILQQDPIIAVWWATEIECVSVVSRMERRGDLTAQQARESLNRLDTLQQNWHEIDPVATVRSTARRILRVHPLRAADAVQLAAALVASEAAPSSLQMITLDRRLGEAARREGLVVPELA